MRPAEPSPITADTGSANGTEVAMIQVEDLRKTYRIGFWRKSVEALRGVSFEVKEGDLYGFIGPNGAGKSTTIKILLGLLTPGSGKASLMGLPAGSPRSR